MRIIRFLDENNAVRHGVDYDGETAELLDENPLHGAYPTGERLAVAKLLAPVEPRAIFCIGLNYHRHAEEMGAALPEHPVVFMKNPASVNPPGDPIVIPPVCREPEQVDYEAELAVVIGKAAKDVPAGEADDHILGYTAANDVSARHWQKQRGGGQWVRGKSFDTFCPLGPALVTPDELDPRDLRISATVNGKTVQDARTSDMIFPVPDLIAFLSQGTTLLPGTVILTGTPSGVGVARNPPVFLRDGDEVTVEIEGIGTLTSPVAAG